MSKVAWVAVCGLALAGCGERLAPPLPQWRVQIATDASVPQFGDRLLVEVLDDAGQACTGCRRQFGVADPSAWPVSFGIAAPESGSVRVRARLYRASITGYDGTPGSDRLLDALVRLPTPEEITDVGIRLSMGCFGVVAHPEADTSCDPESGALAPVPVAPPLADPSSLPVPGSWEPGLERDCPFAVESDMVCIPGGALLLGTPDFVPIGWDVDPLPEQLVALSPFALDVDEMTVGRMRALVAQHGVPAPVPKTPATPRCTYVATGDDELPVNCVTPAVARAACQALGRRLPTEAEWEYAAGNRDAETRYPWGTDDPCDHAVVARGDATDVSASYACRTNPSVPAGPQPHDPETTDVTRLGLRDMGGNMSEWVEDRLVPYYDEACWGEAPLLHVDPLCAAAGMPAARGGSWASLPMFAGVALRDASTGSPNEGIGFRCAR